MSGAAPAPALTPLTVYRRDVTASLARIWENVLDWEHLPWLHRGAFLGVRLLESWRDGWRAEVHVPPAAAARTAEIAVHLDRPALRYRTTTLSGFGTGSDIVTELAPIGPTTTAITVAFHVPGVDPADRDAHAAGYTRLYHRLWDEDEAMMVRRQARFDAHALRCETDARRGNAVVAAPRSLLLGDEAEVRARLPFVVTFGEGDVRLVELGREIVAHTTVCPHLGGPLDKSTVEADCITCPWHGYRFDLRSGANADGHACRLDPAPKVAIDPSTRQVLLVAP